MYKIGFDNDAYLKTQSEKIAERIAKCDPTLHDVELIIRRASFKSLKLKISNSPFYLYVGDDV